MINTDKHIEYWKNGAISDFETAELLIDNQKLLHGLFFCHLVIEKAVKAHIVKKTSEIPPKSHNLLLLAQKAEIDLTEGQKDFLGILMVYQIEGRYPDHYPQIPSEHDVKKYLSNTRDLFQWLIEIL